MTKSVSNVSIRTMMLVTLGIALLIMIFTRGAPTANIFHSILVLSFAIPGASWGYDREPTSRSLVLGLCLWAVIGTLILSIYAIVAPLV